MSGAFPGVGFLDGDTPVRSIGNGDGDVPRIFERNAVCERLQYELLECLLEFDDSFTDLLGVCVRIHRNGEVAGASNEIACQGLCILGRDRAYKQSSATEARYVEIDSLPVIAYVRIRTSVSADRRTIRPITTGQNKDEIEYPTK